jgi:putative FmdB family regulatory protein
MTYEYACEACGHMWEADQSIKDSPLKKCPSCGKDSAKRQISGGAGFILKGGGWYADGYASAGAGDSKSSKDGSSSDSSSKSDSSSSKSDSSGSSGSKSDKSSKSSDSGSSTKKSDGGGAGTGGTTSA